MDDARMPARLPFRILAGVVTVLSWCALAIVLCYTPGREFWHLKVTICIAAFQTVWLLGPVAVTGKTVWPFQDWNS